MKIVIIGYGKMGKTIERIAKESGHSIVGHIDINTSEEERTALYLNADVGIEFSHPDAAFANIKHAITHGLPVVSGTTGWLAQYDEIQSLVTETSGSFFYASNYSIGVNIFWSINERLAQVMNDYPNYNIQMEEIHHIHKMDQPSGTAITTVEGITQHNHRKENWTLNPEGAPNEISINCIRQGEVFGTHTVEYVSPIDTIRLNHEAHTRDGFGQGAVMAAQWILGKQGVFGMKEMLGL